jgi:hypothetical protein
VLLKSPKVRYGSPNFTQETQLADVDGDAPRFVAGEPVRSGASARL